MAQWGVGAVAGDEEFWGDLLGNIRDQNLVMVVGPDVTVVEFDNAQRTLSSLIEERLAEQFPRVVSLGMTLDQAVSAIVGDRGRAQAELRLYRVINEIIGDLEPVPGSALRDLAAITDLGLFVSMTSDGLLAQAVRQTRSAGWTRELTASSNRPTSQQPSNEPEPAPGETVVLNLFGRSASTRQYAIHEEDRLEWIHALLRDEASLPDWLTHQLRSWPMLFVGCEMPDWVGRFLLRLTSNTRLSREEKQVFVVGAPNSFEPSLSHFCETYCGTAQVQWLEMDPVVFARTLRSRWEHQSKSRSRSGLPSTVDAPGSRAPDAATIFISYMREDVAAAEQLCTTIQLQGGVVWFDRCRLRPGDAFDDEILTAISDRTIRLFVPIISANTEREEEGYVFKEWRAAVDRARGIMGRSFIVPVVVDEDYSGDPSRYRRMPIAFREFDFGRAPGGHPDERLVEMFKEEIRNMRRRGAS